MPCVECVASVGHMLSVVCVPVWIVLSAMC